MGQLSIPQRNIKEVSHIYKNNNYSNHDAVEKLVRYITRSREHEIKAESLITYGGAGVAYYLSPGDMIQQITYVQRAFRIDSRCGRRMYHEVFNLYDSEVERLNFNSDYLWKIGMECCQIYFQKGFQVVFAVHWEPQKRYHIHFAVSAINYSSGLKWHTSLPEIKVREQIFNQVLLKYQHLYGARIAPIFFLDSKEKERSAW